MKKVHNLSKYVKTHKLVSLGVVASAAALVATGIGTYSYFSDSKTANTNITLNKGTVTLDDQTEDTWVYLGNTTDLSSATLIDSNDISVKNLTKPEKNYSGRVVNPDLTSGETKISDSSLLSGTSFSNIVPGDVFRKTYVINYTGTNSADISLKIGLDSSWNTKGTPFKNSYDYVVDYSIEEKGPSNTITSKVLPTTIFGNIQNTSDWNDMLSSNGFKFGGYVLKPNQIVKLYVTVKIKNTSDYLATGDTDTLKQSAIPSPFSSINDKFTFTVKNHLETKPVSTKTASN